MADNKYSELKPASRGAGAPPSKFGWWQALHISVLPAMAAGGAGAAWRADRPARLAAKFRKLAQIRQRDALPFGAMVALVRAPLWKSCNSL